MKKVIDNSCKISLRVKQITSSAFNTNIGKVNKIINQEKLKINFDLNLLTLSSCVIASKSLCPMSGTSSFINFFPRSMENIKTITINVI
jgi:hypothetical protein